MKRFNIAKSNFRINGHTMPVGMIYGDFYNFDGKRITYMVSDTKPYMHKNEIHYWIFVFNYKYDKWNEVCTASSPVYHELADYLSRKFEEYNIAPWTHKVIPYAEFDNSAIRKRKCTHGIKSHSVEYIY